MITSSYVYDGAGRVTHITHAGAAGVIADYEQGWDVVGQLVSVQSTDGTSSYTYDADGQLLGAHYTFQADQTFGYDANGNLTDAGVGTDNRILSDGTYNYTYDAEGNRIRRVEIATGTSVEYQWDQRNRLVGAITRDAAGNVVQTEQIRYDDFGWKIERTLDADGAGPQVATTERFVHDRDQIVMAFADTATPSEIFTYGPRIDMVLSEQHGAELRWTLADHLGSVGDVVSSSGAVLDHLIYDAFGRITSQTDAALAPHSRNATVTDQDSSTLVGATIGVTSGTFAGDNDVLAASTSGTGITASYDSATEMLTLAGTDTLGHYQSVFESVTFATTSAGANPTRTITWVVNDGNPAFNLSPPVRTTVSIFTVNSAPVVMPSNSSIVSGHSNAVAASSLFTASDADGDPPTQYDFWDSGSAGGHWLLNGTALPNGQDNFISASQLSQVTYQGGAGTETLWLRASDGLVYGAWAAITATDTAPVLTVNNSNITVGHSNPVAASTLFTASDQDGDSIVQYDFWDSGSGGGHWLLNGNALPNGQDNFVPASQLSLVTYRGGAGTETLWERASDGIQYGAWVSLNATGTESAPVVAPTSTSVVASYKSSVAATTLFTVYDQDGDAITQYDFWDNGMGGGHWSINGVAQGSSVEIIVNASQLSQVTYTPGAGTDTLFVRANDGLLWSAWTMGFSATDTAPVSTPVHNLVGGAGTGKTYAVSDLFAVSDADGDAPTQYDFWDNGAGGGHWFIGNATQGSNQEILVNASQLSQVTYHAGTGSGTDTIYMRATDGLHFGAWTSGVAVLNAPVANPNQSAFILSHTQSVAASTLFTATDAHNDAIAQYDFWDNGMGAGHWSINGTPQGSNMEIVVNASQLSLVTYTPGAGTDTLYMRVSDGSTGFGPWAGGFTATDAAPVSTRYTTSLVASTGQTLAASNLFTASDADGDSITQYDFWDTGAGGGHWFIGNAAQGSNQEILVNASQLSLVSYHAGMGSDTLYVRANDGLQWGAWTPFTASGGTQPSSVTVPAGGGVEIATAASSTNASFASNTGTLKLDDFAALHRHRRGPGRSGLPRPCRHQFHQRHDDRDLDERHQRRGHAAGDRRHPQRQHRAARQLPGLDLRALQRWPRRYQYRRPPSRPHRRRPQPATTRLMSLTGCGYVLIPFEPDVNQQHEIAASSS